MRWMAHAWVGFCATVIAGCTSTAPGDLVLTSVSPANGSNDAPVVLTIQGQNLKPSTFTDFVRPDKSSVDTTFGATLGTASLSDVQLQADGSLRATVPAGIPPGTYDLSVTDPKNRTAVLPHAYQVLGANALLITSPAQTLTAGACSAPVTVQDRDAAGNPSTLSVATPVALSAFPSAGVGFFLDSACTQPTGSVTLPAGGTGAAFYFADSHAEAFTLTASASGWTPATQTETIHPGPTATLVWAPVASPQVADRTIGVMVTARDALGNVTPSFPGPASLSLLPAGSVSCVAQCADSATTGPFSSGVWNGAVLVANAATGVQIAATSGPLSGRSNPFDVVASSAILQSISVTPASPTIASGTSVQLVATGVYSDSTLQDLTNLATWTSSDITVASVSSAAGSAGLARGVAPGTAILSASYSGVAGAGNVQVTAATLVSIAITPPSRTLALGTSIQLTATGIFSDSTRQDLTSQVGWQVSDPSVATISNLGLAAGIAPGSTTVSASLLGVTGTTALTVSAATLQEIQVTPTDPSIAYQTLIQFAATGVFSDGSVQDLTAIAAWSSSSTSVAIISTNTSSAGLATAVAPGATTISATLAGVTGTDSLAVTSATLQSISVTPASPTIANGPALQLVATGIFSDGTNENLTSLVTWSTTNASVAVVSNAAGANGLATAMRPGTTGILATFSGVAGAATLTVSAATLQSIAVTPANAVLAAGGAQQFVAIGTLSDGSTQDLTRQATWSSSSPAVATISNATGSSGWATLLSAGSATISAAYAGIAGSTGLTVSSATLQSLAITPVNPTLALGVGLQLVATATYSDGSSQDVTRLATWTSAAASVAMVSNASGSNGLLAAVSVGTTGVSASFGGVTGTANVTVSAATLQSIAVTPANPAVAAGTTQQFAATGTYSDGSTQSLTALATWKSSNTAVATVSNAAGSNGLASSSAQGTTTVSATYSGVSGGTLLTVVGAVLQSITVTPVSPSLQVGATQQFVATATYSDGSSQNLTSLVTWSVSNSSVATISNSAGSNGVATAVASGTTTVSAASAGVTGSTVLTVSAASLTSVTVTPVNPSLATGATVQFTATGHYSDGSTQDLTASATWSSSIPSVGTVSNSAGSQGLATAVAAGSTTISATILGQTGTSVLTVSTASLTSIAVTPSPAAVAAGTTVQMTATGSYSDGSVLNVTSSATWTSSNTSVATVSSAGLATGVAAGSATVTASLFGVSGSASIQVASWSFAAAGTTQTLVAIYGSAANDVWAVGGGGTLLHNNGSIWLPTKSPTANQLNGVSGTGTSDVWAVGAGGVIAHWNGTAWSSVTSPTGQQLNTIWAWTTTDAWAVANGGTVINWNGTTWSTVSTGVTQNLLGVWGSGAGDVWAVGQTGGLGQPAIVIHWNGTAWSKASGIPGAQQLNDVWGSASSDVWAVGNGGLIIHWNGSAWSSVTSPTTSNLLGVWGSGAGDVWAVGQTGGAGQPAIVIHWNGTAWSKVTSPTTNQLNGVWGSSSADVWAVGAAGTIVSGGGAAWSNVSSPTAVYLAGVWGSSATDFWAVGASGTILHF